MKPFIPLSIFSAAIFFLSCTSSEIGNSKDVNPSTIYMQYNVSYSEGDDSLNCILQYRFAGDKGTTLVLTPPSKTEIDGKEITVDSGFVSGAYYSKNFAANNFSGDHVIKFTDINGKTYKEPFSFELFSCKTELPQTIGRKNLLFEFAGSKNGDIIHVDISDTASSTGDIEKNVTIRNNQLEISALELKSLSNGPLIIQFYKKQELPLRHPTEEGGKLTISNSLKPIETVLTN